MSLKHKRTKACAISMRTKLNVYKRDGGCCIFCGRCGLPEAHVISRAQGGLGCEENIITVCRLCHDKLDNSTERKKMIQVAEDYLKKKYPGWKRENFIFDKWRKDKAKKTISYGNTATQVFSDEFVTDKSQKDKGEPPDGFRFL